MTVNILNDSKINASVFFQTHFLQNGAKNSKYIATDCPRLNVALTLTTKTKKNMKKSLLTQYLIYSARVSRRYFNDFIIISHFT